MSSEENVWNFFDKLWAKQVCLNLAMARKSLKKFYFQYQTEAMPIQRCMGAVKQVLGDTGVKVIKSALGK